MKVKKVWGAEQVYEFEDGEMVPFWDKARFAEKKAECEKEIIEKKEATEKMNNDLSKIEIKEDMFVKNKKKGRNKK